MGDSAVTKFAKCVTVSVLSVVFLTAYQLHGNLHQGELDEAGFMDLWSTYTHCSLLLIWTQRSVIHLD